MNGNRDGWFQRFFDSKWANLLPIANAAPGQKQTEALVRHLMREARKREVWETPIDETKFVVVDSETTGFDPHADVLLSLGVVEMRGAERVPGRTWETLIRPEPFCSVPPRITELTGIRDADVERAPTLGEVLPRFLEFAKGAVLVMHHAGHDVSFLNAALRRKYRAQLPHRVVDAHLLAKWLHPEWESHALDDLVRRYEVPVEGRHTALGDAEMTAQVLTLMLAEARARGIVLIGDLFEGMILSRNRSFKK